MVELSALKGAYLVAGLKDEEIAQIAALALIKLYRSGECILTEGSPSNELFILLSGKVSVTTNDGDLLGEMGPGCLLNEIGLVDALPANGNVSCIGPVSAAAIPMGELRKLMSRNREWGFVMLSNVSRVLAGRLRQTNARIDALCDLTEKHWDHPVD